MLRLVCHAVQCFVIFIFLMSALNLIPGDKIRVIGGVYVGNEAEVVKVTKHMYWIRLISSIGGATKGDVVSVMSGNVEKIITDASKVAYASKLLQLRDRMDVLLELLSKLHVQKG